MTIKSVDNLTIPKNSKNSETILKNSAWKLFVSQANVSISKRF